MTSLLLSVLWSSVVSDRKLLKSEVEEQEVGAIARLIAPSMGFYIGIIALAIVVPRIAAFGYLVVAIIELLRAQGARAPSTAAH